MSAHGFCQRLFYKIARELKIEARNVATFSDKVGGKFIISVGKPFNREFQINECCAWSAKYQALNEIRGEKP
jgi:hypothetical protein